METQNSENTILKEQLALERTRSNSPEIGAIIFWRLASHFFFLPHSPHHFYSSSPFFLLLIILLSPPRYSPPFFSSRPPTQSDRLLRLEDWYQRFLSAERCDRSRRCRVHLCHDQGGRGGCCCNWLWLSLVSSLMLSRLFMRSFQHRLRPCQLLLRASKLRLRLPVLSEAPIKALQSPSEAVQL